MDEVRTVGMVCLVSSTGGCGWYVSGDMGGSDGKAFGTSRFPGYSVGGVRWSWERKR